MMHATVEAPVMELEQRSELSPEDVDQMINSIEYEEVNMNDSNEVTEEASLPSHKSSVGSSKDIESLEEATSLKQKGGVVTPAKSDWEEFVEWFNKWTEDGIGMMVALSLFVLSIIVSAAGADLSDSYAATSQWPIGAGLIALYVVTAGDYMLGKPSFSFGYYTVIFFIAVIARSIGNYSVLRDAGLSASLWAILIGIGCRFFYLFPDLVTALSTKKLYNGEFFVKIGVTLLAMDYTSIIAIGGPGLVVAWVDTLLILTVGIFLCKKVMGFVLADAIVIAGATSICGSSAATALAASITPKGSADAVAKTMIAIMGVFNAPLMPIMPLWKTAIHVNPVVVGSWIGGSIDSTGQVTASAQMGGDTVLRSAIIIKMAQNLLIGPLCLFFTTYYQRSLKWTLLVSKFPCFVTGFLLTSTVATIFLQSSVTTSNLSDLIIPNSWCISEWLTLIGFVVIGLEIDLREFMILGKKGDGAAAASSQMKTRVFAIYLVIQLLDLISTFGWSYLMFHDKK
jgi:uncharacterized membrane protein YadS